MSNSWLPCFHRSKPRKPRMHRPLSRILCSTVLLLAVGSVDAAAIENQPARAVLEALVPGAKVSCSSHGAPAEPFDPSATSALPHNEKFMAGEHFKGNISPAAETRISWLGATFMRRFAVKIEDDPGDVMLQTYALNRSSSSIQIIAEIDDHHET